MSTGTSKQTAEPVGAASVDSGSTMVQSSVGQGSTGNTTCSHSVAHSTDSERTRISKMEYHTGKLREKIAKKGTVLNNQQNKIEEIAHKLDETTLDDPQKLEKEELELDKLYEEEHQETKKMQKYAERVRLNKANNQHKGKKRAGTKKTTTRATIKKRVGKQSEQLVSPPRRHVDKRAKSTEEHANQSDIEVGVLDDGSKPRQHICYICSDLISDFSSDYARCAGANSCSVAVHRSCGNIPNPTAVWLCEYCSELKNNPHGPPIRCRHCKAGHGYQDYDQHLSFNKKVGRFSHKFCENNCIICNEPFEWGIDIVRAYGYDGSFIHDECLNNESG